MSAARPLVTLAGHPYAPSGRGEDVRATFRSLAAAGVPCGILDIYGFNNRDHDIEREIGAAQVEGLGDGVNLFLLNGDEVEPALQHLQAVDLPRGYNIICPTWELARYPAEWAKQLDRFDEIWAPSAFIEACLKGAVSGEVRSMPLATEVKIHRFLSRRAFGIPESGYVFLFFFDFTSYIARKNPFAAIDAFLRLAEARPQAPITFVIKLNNGRERGADYDAFKQKIIGLRDRIMVIDRRLSDNEMKNLVWASDCFLSLHRSEGYGRGLAEAMVLGKPVIATGYSGNMDFTTPQTALLVDYELKAVEPGAYPHGEGQVWAEADVAQAVAHMVKLIDEPMLGRRLGEAASRHMRQHFGYLASGLRYRRRIEDILAVISEQTLERNIPC